MVVVKCSMSHGYVGIDNEFSTAPKTGMFFTDTKKGLSELKGAASEFVSSRTAPRLGPADDAVPTSVRGISWCAAARADRARRDRSRSARDSSTRCRSPTGATALTTIGAAPVRPRRGQ
ncbi:hypothetical protein ACRJ4W_13030 [Streptomyces sp. GLT-R25]